MWRTLRVTVPLDDLDEASGRLWLAGAAGIEERPAGADIVDLLAGFDRDPAIEAGLAAVAGRWLAEVGTVEGTDWLDAWRAHARAARVGRLLVQPAWLEPGPTADDDLVIELDPGHAFGSGTHESTRLVLAELVARLLAGHSMLDVGCGSGVLSVAALLLGASHVTAIDIDPEAVRATLDNLERNGVADRATVSGAPLAGIPGEFDLVVANIGASVLIDLAPALRARVRPGGGLVLSGMLVEQAEPVTAAFDALVLERTMIEGAWASLVFRA